MSMTNAGSIGPARRARWFGPARLRQWAEWTGIAAVFAAAAALAWFNEDLSEWQRVAGWSFPGVMLAFLLRKGWVRLFGPVLFYDLVRNARRTRTYLTRCGYLALLLLFLWAIVEREAENLSSNRGAPDPKAMAALAESFFATFLGVQFGLVVFLTPAYVASAITEEKERKTLEFLLATDLDSREIVLGKLVARVGYLTLLLLTGLPVLSAVQFLGGVEPILVFAGFAATALTMASLAGISILASVYANRSRDAILLTYLAVGLYCGLCLLGSAIIDMGVFPARPLFPDGPSLNECINGFQAGNPFYVISRTFWGPAGPLRSIVPTVLFGYAIFHVLLTLVTVTLAVLRLRPIALREASVTNKAAKHRLVQRSVSERPMVWKEMYFGGGMRFRRWSLVMVVLGVALSFAPVPFMAGVRLGSEFKQYVRDLGPMIAGLCLFGVSLYGSGRLRFRRWSLVVVGIGIPLFLCPLLYITAYDSPYGRSVSEFNAYVRGVGTIVASVCLLGVAVRGSVAVRIERDKDTLDALLTSPLTTQEILVGKWLGCLWGLRWPGLWLGGIYAVGLLTGGLSLLAVPLLVGAILVYAGTLAVLGLWFSVICRTTVRATVATVFSTLGLSVGHWLLWLCCLPFGGSGRDVEMFWKVQTGITPPFVIGVVLPFSADDSDWLSHESRGEWLSYAVLGTIAWAILGGILWALVNERFQRETNRDVLRSEKRDPERRPNLELKDTNA
jgi:ABC-type transport system involved in multi-copper enzyme maturation permease subunit